MVWIMLLLEFNRNANGIPAKIFIIEGMGFETNLEPISSGKTFGGVTVLRRFAK